MDVFFSVVVFVVLFIASYICIMYSRMDKFKMHATIYAKQLRTTLDKWVSVAIDNIEAPGFSDEMRSKIRALADDYYNIKKKKNAIKRIPFASAIAEELLSLVENPSVHITGARDDPDLDFDQLLILQAEYNSCVWKLENLLAKPLPSIIGKIFRVKRLTELGYLIKISELNDQESLLET